MTRQREHLVQVIRWAQRIRDHLGGLQMAEGHRVHFRPSSGGVAMVGLSADRPQRGKSGIRDFDRLQREFERLYAKHCVDVDQGRPTPEKRVQSFLLRDAHTHGRRMATLNDAAGRTDGLVDLVFVTDELAVPVAGGWVVCDVLALREPNIPVIIELKSERQMTRLIAQVEGYAAIIVEHVDLFSRLFSVILGRELNLAPDPEKWIVWPQAGDVKDPREDELAARGVRVVGYRVEEGESTFRVGREPSSR
jgi:hypothetical protein